jgi:hypothetical protein
MSASMPKPIAAMLLLLCIPALGPRGDPRSSSEKGKFDIYVAGKKIGQEKFEIQNSANSIHSSSVLNFRDPARRNERVRIETELTMDPEYVPKSYRLSTDIGGRKVTMTGNFIAGQADFEYWVDGISRKRGLLVGDRFIMLDTNVFHHFAFAAKLFDFKTRNPFSMEVVVPQELANGIINVFDAGTEEISLKGKARMLNHLKVDSGSLLIDLWADDQGNLYKIALPAKGLEAILNR